MVAWPKAEVGIVACGGEELAEGTVSLAAVRLVVEELRPRQTVTISLPFLVTGGRDQHAFAKVYLTVAIDGCTKRCAARALAAFSVEPAVEVVVSDVARRFPELVPASRRELGAAGQELARRVAEQAVRLVDELRSRPAGPWALRSETAETRGWSPGGACPCQAKGPPVTTVAIAGQPVGLVGLQPVLQELARATGLSDQELAGELLRRIRIYNYVPSAQEGAYAEAIWREFLAYRAQAKR